MTRALRINGFAGEIKWPPPLVADQVSWIEKRRINNYGGRRERLDVEDRELVQSFSEGFLQFFGKFRRRLGFWMDSRRFLGFVFNCNHADFNLICKIIRGLYIVYRV